MRRRNAAAILAIALAVPAVATAGPQESVADPTPWTCDWRTVHRHVHAAKGDVDRAFHPDAGRHLRSTKAWQPHKFCLMRKHDRTRVAEYVDEKQRAEKRRDRRGLYQRLIYPPGAGVLAAIRGCESGGDYYVDSTYDGAYQFDQQTWGSTARAYAKSGWPEPVAATVLAASPKQQDIRAAILYRMRGSSPWPVCGV